MGLLESLKSALGLGSSRDTEPDASSERAVKEPTGAAGGTSQSDSADTGGDTTADTDAEAAAHADESPDEPTGADAAEPAETTEPVPEAPEDGHEHVESISGIGPAYAKRLGDAGIESVAELADADADALADETGVSAKRIRRWIERAEEY